VSQLIPLSALPAGQMAQVRQIVGQPPQVKRLAELGIRDGADICVVQSGSPCIVQLNASRLCFRDGDLLRVLVEPGATVGVLE